METSCLVAAPTLLVLRGEPGRRFVTAHGVQRLPTTTIEYFPTGRWYNIVSFFDPDSGALRQHFCNAIAPAVWDGHALSYVDLDLDLVVNANGDVSVEDLDDFRCHARAWRYPAAVRHGALAALRELRALALCRRPPFTAAPLAATEALIAAYRHDDTVLPWRVGAA